MCQDPTIK